MAGRLTRTGSNALFAIVRGRLAVRAAFAAMASLVGMTALLYTAPASAQTAPTTDFCRDVQLMVEDWDLPSAIQDSPVPGAVSGTYSLPANVEIGSVRVVVFTSAKAPGAEILRLFPGARLPDDSADFHSSVSTEVGRIQPGTSGKWSVELLVPSLEQFNTRDGWTWTAIVEPPFALQLPPELHGNFVVNGSEVFATSSGLCHATQSASVSSAPAGETTGDVPGPDPAATDPVPGLEPAQPSRGFLTNDPSSSFALGELDDPTTLSVIGILVTVVAAGIQLVRGK